MDTREDCAKLLTYILNDNPNKSSFDVFIAKLNEEIVFSEYLNSQIYGYKNEDTPAELKVDGVFKEIKRIENISGFNAQLEKSSERIIGSFLETKPEYREKVFSDDLIGVFKVKLTSFNLKRWLDKNGFSDTSKLSIQGSTDKKKGKLTLYKEGTVVYISNSGKEYEANLKTKSNPYLLLSYLSRSPGNIYSTDELEQTLRKPRTGGESSTSDRRVRDTIQTIRKAFGLSKADDPFLLNNGFGLGCDIEIRN